MTKENKKKKSDVNKKGTLVLLDSHAILHRAYHALPDFASSKGEPTGALYGLSMLLLKIIGDLKPEYIFACYDLPSPTYRHQAYDGYKSGRKKSDPALVEQIIKSQKVFEAFNIPVYSKEGFEADDMLGTIVEKTFKEKKLAEAIGKVFIASGDMDTLQLISDKKVQVYTLKKGIKDTIIYDEEGVKARFGFGPELLPDFKGLRGDPSDNIIGIAGIGEKTATTLITTFGSIEEIYKVLKKDKEKIKKAGITDRIISLLEAGEEEALFSKMLATIRRDAPIDVGVPKKRWIDGVEKEKVTALFKELEFRSLGERFNQVCKVMNGKNQPENIEESKSSKPKENEEKSNNLDQDKLKETAVALWIIDSNITNPKLEDILNYAGTEDFEKAREYIFGELKKRGEEKIFENIEKPLMPIVEKMHTHGIKVDTGYLQKLSKEYHKELEILEKKIWEAADQEFNINSPKQLGEILFQKMGLKLARQKKTAGGAMSTKESELEKMRELHPIIGHVLNYRELQKLLSTYIDTIPSLVSEDGRLHARFLQAGSTTGRMASQDPNLQNIPIKTELGRNIRHAFVAEKGFSLCAFDYSQIELRIAAFLSGDKKLMEVFTKGEDVHTSVAAQVFEVEPAKVTKEMRRKAKVINFGILYGMGVNALKINLGSTREEAQQFYEKYFQTFSGLANYLDRVKAEAARQGYTETFFGRKRWFEGIKSKLPFIRAAAERMAINAPIQGTEADIVKLAMIETDKYLVKAGYEDRARLLLQVHDELVYEIEEDLIKELSGKIKEIMSNIMSLKDTKSVPIVVNVAVGKNWGEMEG
ncbi:MAG: DNA polymerase [Candidatus Pacebacteria bacterium]|nr:DNA polymerase [Candidatus Paceibacterota bacterium]